MDIDTWVSLAVLVGGLAGMYWALRREINEVRAELKDTRSELRDDIARLDHRVSRLDDHVYALAVGLKPHIERAQHADG